MTLIGNDDWKKKSRGVVMNEKRQDSSPGPTSMVACRGYGQLRDALPAIRADHALSPSIICDLFRTLAISQSHL